MKYDLLLKNGLVTDYDTDVRKISDIAIKDGKIARVELGINASEAREVHEIDGLTVMPGIVDPHVHVSSWLGGGAGHKMLAKAGVTSALDMSGPGESVLDLVATHGVGVNIATIEYVRPGHTVSSTTPGEKEIAGLLDKVLKQGSIGVKMLGGHYPLTPEATGRCIKMAAKREAYIAFHAGTTDNGSNLEGFLEAIAIADGQPLHLAHINAYCRGLIKPYMEETEIAVQALIDNPNIFSEAYLSPVNGTSAEIVNGVPDSNVTKRCLLTGGFTADEKGMEEAIDKGWAQINYPYVGETILITGKQAIAYWRSKNTDVTVSFAVNPIEPRIRLLSARRPDNNSFVVDCISTDGGGIPRNVTIPLGLALIDLGALSWKDFVQKTSYNPSKMLGLANKGSLAEGKDADITVINPIRREAEMSFVGGAICLYKGAVFGKGGKIITTKDGEAYIKSKGLDPIVTTPKDRGLRG